MKKLNLIFKQIFILFLLISFTGCENDEISTKLPDVIAGFTYKANQETGTVEFLNISENATKYLWSFGDGNTSTEINPIQTYTTGTYTVTLKASNTAGDSDTLENELIITIVDAGTPVITLIGDATMNIKPGDAFTDPGATATDDVDGDLTNDIVVVNPVDNNTEATYTITYNVSDSSGNAATEVTRTVIVAAIACDSETSESMSALDLNVTFMTDQTDNITDDGAAFEWTNNPNVENDLNSSCKVGEITKLGNALWDNTQINLDAKLDFDANAGLKIKVFSAKAGFKVTIKLEEQGKPNNNTELEVVSTKTSEWEELTFPFDSSNSNKFDKIVMFFDLNGDNTDTYYFDDLKVYAGDGGGGVCTPETSESMMASNLNMTFMTDQSGNIISDGAGFEWVDNPDSDNAVNNSCKIAKISKSGQFDWDNNQFDLDAKLDFTSNTGLKIKVWSAKANTKVTIKLEEIGKPTNNNEKSLTTSVTSEWEELTFPFTAGDSDKFDKIVIFFDLAAGDSDTYYFDDLMLYGDSSITNPPNGDCPAPPSGELLSNGNFEAGDAGCWQFLPGSSLSTAENNGGTKSGEIQGAKNVAVGLKQERFAIGVVEANTSYTVTFDIKADGAFGEGGVMKAFAYSEPAEGTDTGAALHTLTDNTTSLSTNWETKTYTFTSANSNQIAGGISFLIEIVNSTAKLNIDNVVVKKTP
tara:strand:+ start:26904 stop:29000 length:2097 start_codon:yes stop_codon:yes gene_type:complete